LEKDPNNGHALERIADCYFQLNQSDEAVNWYKRAIEHREPNSEVQLRYGRVLMFRGNYDQARKEFLEYAALNDNATQTGRHYADMCDFAIKTAKIAPDFTARNEALNTSSSDFAPAFLGNRVVYSSARTDIVRKTQSKTSSDWTGSSNNQLFVTQRNPENGTLQKPDFLHNDLQYSYNESPASFSADGKKVAFCRNNFVNGTRQIAVKGLNMSLYIGDVVNGEWTNVKAFPYNGTDYATGFPCLIGNGNTIVYASNDPATTTGGKGWDIYISHFVNGEWSTPRNLGAPTNTPGNEVTPYYDGTDLYFASDWHNGLGGLDVFRAEVAEKNVKNVYHLGPGINSSHDDYGFVYNNQTKLGYLTSNRPGGRGNEDIWQITKTGSNTGALATAPAAATATSASLADVMAGRSTTTTPAQAPANSAFTPQNDVEEGTIKSYYLFVTDGFGKPLPGVDVDMFECSGERGQTDTEGRYYFSSPAKPHDCVVQLSRNGYEGASVQVREFGMRNVTTSLAIDNRQEFTGMVLDARTKQPLGDVTVDYTDKGKTIRTNTDQFGKYALLVAPGATYTVEYSRYGYATAKVPTRPVAATSGNKLPDVTLGFETGAAGVKAPPPGTSTAPSQFSNPAAPQPTQYSNPAATQPAQYSTIQSKTTTPNPAATPAAAAGTTTLLTANHPIKQPEFNGYAIQLSAIPTDLTEADKKKYEELAAHGNVYTKSEDGKNKVRIGIFATKAEAQEALKTVNKYQQLKGSFIVEERGADKSLLLTKPKDAPVQYSTQPASTSTAKTITTTPPPPTSTGGNGAVCYAIQLTSSSTGKPISVNEYSNISNLGNMYGKVENGSVRMRLGVWPNHDDAEAALNQVVQKGYKDAVIVTEKSNDESVKDFIITKDGPVTPVKPVAHANDGSKYYVRLCALSNPNSFDANKLEGAGVSGTVEKWPVGNKGMTAIVLAGYTSFEAANQDKDKVRSSGFPEAFVVRELKGTITKMN
jgi:cell division septation protein DedD